MLIKALMSILKFEKHYRVQFLDIEVRFRPNRDDFYVSAKVASSLTSVPMALGKYLFSFRTQKSSPVAAIILRKRETSTMPNYMNGEIGRAHV